jgi:putative restriction endonuclease
VRPAPERHDEVVSDLELRAAAMSHVAALANRHGVLTWAQIDNGFVFRGERIRLAGRARGIFKPRQLGDGALSVRTPQPREGRVPRYDDQIASDRPWFEYRWMGDDPRNDASGHRCI